MKKPIITIKGTVEVREDLTLTELAEKVGELQAKLRELGDGRVTLKMPRGEYGV